MKGEKIIPVEEDTFSHYIKGEIELLEARAAGDLKKEEVMLEELDLRWDLMSDSEIEWMNRYAKVRMKDREEHLEKGKRQSIDVIMDIMLAAYDFTCGGPESMREEDYWTGAWFVAEDILETLSINGFDYRDYGMQDINDFRRNRSKK
jgi:hypothetical protein